MTTTPRVPSTQTVSPGRHLLGQALHPHHARDPEGLGDHGGVAGRAAPLEGEADDVLPLQAGRLGRGELPGDHDARAVAVVGGRPVSARTPASARRTRRSRSTMSRPVVLEGGVVGGGEALRLLVHDARHGVLGGRSRRRSAPRSRAAGPRACGRAHGRSRRCCCRRPATRAVGRAPRAATPSAWASRSSSASGRPLGTSGMTVPGDSSYSAARPTRDPPATGIPLELDHGGGGGHRGGSYRDRRPPRGAGSATQGVGFPPRSRVGRPGPAAPGHLRGREGPSSRPLSPGCRNGPGRGPRSPPRRPRRRAPRPRRPAPIPLGAWRNMRSSMLFASARVPAGVEMSTGQETRTSATSAWNSRARCASSRAGRACMPRS